MKNNNVKKIAGRTKLFSAIGMFTVSAVMLASSTYAWFTMNKDVTVTGLQMTAEAEDGIVIAAYTNHGATAPAGDSAYSENANAYDVPQTLLPTFTNDATTWYHAWSTMITNGQSYGAEGYSMVKNGTDDYTAPSDGDKNYYLLNRFKIKSSNAPKAVYVKDIQVTSGGAKTYDSSLRVLIKSTTSGETPTTVTQIFKTDGTAWTETAAASVADDDDIATNVVATGTVINSNISPIMTAPTTGQDVLIYVYYDGEDAACKSENIDFDQTTIKVTFTSDATQITNHASGGSGSGGESNG